MDTVDAFAKENLLASKLVVYDLGFLTLLEPVLLNATFAQPFWLAIDGGVS